METHLNKISKVHSIDTIIDYYVYLKQMDYNIIVVCDIDDTILSSKIGQKFVEKNIKILIEDVYKCNPDNLIFLTAREFEYKRATNNQLNSAKMHHKTCYILYNLLMSPDDINGCPTKGETFLNYFVKGKGQSLLCETKKNYILFIDDLKEQIKSVENCITRLNNIDYILFHYCFA